MQREGIDTLVLGCTHYPFLIPVIEEILGDGVRLVDPSAAVARQVARLVPHEAPGGAKGTVEYLTTGDPAAFAAQLRRLVGGDPQVQRVEL